MIEIFDIEKKRYEAKNTYLNITKEILYINNLFILIYN